MKKHSFVFGTIFIACAILAGAYAYRSTLFGKSYTFVCNDDSSIRATFYPKNDTRVDLAFSDGKRAEIPRAMSASGARYVTDDESFVFWNKGDSALVTRVEDGKTTQTTCYLADKERDYKTIEYGIDGRRIALGGEELKYFGNEVRGDFDSDGYEDIAFLMTHQPGGSGTFYYVTVARGTEYGYIGLESVLLGDRIAPQTTEFRDGKIIVNYADRKLTDSFATPPSIGKSKWLLLDKKVHQLGEVMQNFEGEADPLRMKLDMQTWNWIKTAYSNDTTVTPKKEKAFTATFTKDGKVSFTTDCNRMSGAYTVTGNKIAFGPMAMTKMYCEGSQENDFAKMLGEVQSFLFTSKGELIFEFKYDSGQMIFR